MLNRYIAFLNPRERWRFYGVCGLIALGATCESLGLALVLPYIHILQHPELLSSFGSTDPFTLIVGATVAFLLITLLRMGVQIFVSRISLRFAYNSVENHSNRLFQRYLGMDYRTFLTKNSSTLVKNCTQTIGDAATGMAVFVQVLSATCVVAGLTVVLLWDNFLVTLALIVGFGGLAVPVYRIFKKKQREAGRERDRLLNNHCKLTTEAFHCFKEIHLYDKFSYFSQAFASDAKGLSKANADSAFYPVLPSPCLEAGAIFALLSVVIWFLWQDISLDQLVPQLIFYGVIGRRLLPALHQCVYYAMLLQKYQPAMELVHQECLQTPVGIDQVVDPLSFRSNLTFNHVSFCYRPDQTALRDISLSIPCNQSVALVGPSGSGKSTTVEILTSLLNPTEGHFSVDGNRVADLAGLRHQIGYVPQVVNLIDDTIERNIAFGEQVVHTERLYNAIKMAHLDDLIAQLPDGVQTVVGERGVKLSGGQRQRLGIARALYFDPKIIVFDEATASLDTISEQIISENILEIAGHKTILAIAHRISTIKDFDKIYVLDKGQVVASGRHEELIASCPLYQAMNQTHPSENCR